jgi:mannosyltransferase
VSAPSTGRRDAATPPAPAAGVTSSPAGADPVEARSRRGLYLAVAVAAAAMAILGVWGLARRGTMGNDEIASRWAASLSLRQLFHLLRHVDAVHGLYYLLLHGWMVFGTTPTIIRIPSVIIMTAAAGLIVVVGRRLTGSVWAGLFAGLIMAFDPVISFYAQTARSYAMVFFCVLATTLALVWALEAEASGRTGRPLARRWVLYAALLTLGGYLNELSLLVLAAHAATVLLTRYGWPTIRHWAVAGAIGAFLVLPVGVLSIKEDAAEGWLARPTAHDLGVLFHDYFGATNLVAVFMLAFAVFAVLPAAQLPAIRVWRPRPAAGAGPESAWWKRGGFSLPSVAAPLLVLPAGLALVESWVGKPVYADRYFLYGEAGAALLSGAGVYRIGQWIGPWLARHLGTGTAGTGTAAVGTAGRAPGWRSLVWVPGVIVCVCALVLQLGPQQRVRTAQSREFDYGDPAFYIGARAHPGDGVLFFNTFYRKIRLGYPGDFKDITDFAMSVSPAQAGTFNGFNKPWPEVRSLMLTYQRIWVVGRAPSAHVAAPAIRGEGELLLSQYQLIAKRHFKGMVVTLWLRR